MLIMFIFYLYWLLYNNDVNNNNINNTNINLSYYGMGVLHLLLDV